MKKTIPAYGNILRSAPWGSIYKDNPKSSFDSFFFKYLVMLAI